MGVFGAFFGCRGDAGFKAPLLGVSSGVVGFNVATLSRLVREKVRPVWPDVCVSAKKFALHARNTPKSAFLRLLGELFRGSASGGAVLGEFFRANRPWSSPVEWCNRFVSFGLGYALSWSGVSSCWVGWGVSRDLVRMSRLR